MKNKRKVIIVLCAAVLSVGIAAAIMLGSNINSKKPEENKNTDPSHRIVALDEKDNRSKDTKDTDYVGKKDVPDTEKTALEVPEVSVTEHRASETTAQETKAEKQKKNAETRATEKTTAESVLKNTAPAQQKVAQTEPSVTTPAVTEPAVTTPAITVPAVTEPAVTEPAVTEPAVTEPAVTEPAVTEPAVTEPERPEREEPLAMDFTVFDENGNAVNLSDYIGKPIVLNFWASWCGPCKREMPDFNEKYLELGDEVHFLMVNLTGFETEESAKEFVESSGYTFPVFYDINSDAANTYGVSSLPTTYFIDADGYLIARAVGAINAQTLQSGIDMIT